MSEDTITPSVPPGVEGTTRPWQHTSGWTPERVETLKRLNAEGLHPSQIGPVLGISRNAVIGKLRRLNVTLAHAVPMDSAGQRLRTPRVRVRPPPALHPRPRQLTPEGTLAPDLQTIEALALEVAPPEFLGIEFRKLKAKHCRYPRGGDGAPTLYCGQQRQAGSPYCPACHAKCYAGKPRPPMSLSDAERLRRQAAARAYWKSGGAT